MQLALDLQSPRLERALALAVATRRAERVITQVERKARKVDPLFCEAAAAHMLAYLRANGVSSGELLTDSCKLAKIVSTDDRHFGAVFRWMLARELIRWAGPCRRIKGNASRGGSLYVAVRA